MNNRKKNGYICDSFSITLLNIHIYNPTNLFRKNIIISNIPTFFYNSKYYYLRFRCVYKDMKSCHLKITTL